MMGLEIILYIALTILIFAVIALIVVYAMLKKKEKQEVVKETSDIVEAMPSQQTAVASSKRVAKEYDTKSIFDFMEFETVKDNMIVQKGGKKFLMAIECKGINYDLMSEVEKTAAEQGFSAFLNSLRDPIQIYIQTRTINLEKNILEYKNRVEKLRDSLNLKEYKLREYEGKPNINPKILKDKQFEILREKNLYSYGADIVADTKKMSLNKNVLKKKYYIIIRYFYEASDVGDVGTITDEEIREVAFSNLYTRAASIVRVLSGIGIVGKALNSFELVELLYNAFNRDDSEVFSIEKALEAGFDEIYVDAENIVDKKIAALNNELPERAQEEARKAIDQTIDERTQELKEIEENIDTIVAELAKKMILEDERNNIPQDIKDKAIEKIDKKTKKKVKGEEDTDGKSSTKESNKKRRAS